MILAFASYELDDERRELRRAGTPVELQRKPYALLSYLVHHRDRAVPRDELFDHVWPDAVVSDAALTSALRDVRRTLGDDGKRQTWIRTERGRGLRFVADVEVRPSAAAGAATGPPMIGRSEPLARLEAALDDAARRRTRTVLVAGEAGIGKTRLAQEATRRADALGFRSLWGRCWDGEGAPPFWPWTGVVRAALPEASGEALRAALGPRAEWLVHLLPELRGQLSPPSASPDTPGVRFQLFDAVAGLLRSLSGATPLAVVLDDLHWGDAASLELLRFLSAHLTDTRVLLIGTVRDVELEDGDSRASLLADLSRDDAFEEIRLTGLSAEDSAALVTQLVAHEPDPQFLEALQARTSGNPFFIGETLRHVSQLLDDDRRAGAWTAGASLDAAGLAEGVRQLIERRLGSLGEGCREVLDVAAVAGPDFPLELLERVALLADVDVAARLDEAASARAIAERQPELGRWTFGHALIREVVLAGLGAARRRELHRGVGEALEALHASDREPYFAALAHHFEQAGSGDGFAKAFAYAVGAARRSRERFAWEDSAAQFERALRLQERAGLADPKTRCELLVELARVDQDPEKALPVAQRGYALARTLDAPELLALAANTLQSAHWGLDREDPAIGIARLEEALEVLGDRDPALRAMVLARIAYSSAGPGDPRGEAAAVEALETARRAGDVETLSYALGARHYTLWRPERAEERRRVAEEALACAPTPRLRRFAHEWRFLDALRAGDLSGAEDANRGERDAVEAGADRYCWGLTRLHAGTLAMLQGRMAEAEAIAEQLAGAGIGIENGAEGLLCAVRLLQGRLAEPLAWMEAAKARPRSMYSKTREALLVLARVEAGGGAAERVALARLSEPDAVVGATGDAEPTCLALLAETTRRVGDAEAAERLLERLRPYLPQHLVNQAGLYTGSSCHWAGVLSAVLGRHDEAQGLLDQALEGYRALDARPWIAWTEEARAHSLLCRDRPGDRAEAATLLDQALATAQELALEGFEERIRARHAAD